MRHLFFIVLFVAAGSVLLALWSRVRYTRLGQRRRAIGSSYESFRSELGSRVSGEVCRTVYDFFYDITGKRMPVQASDDLGDVYGIVDDDLIDELRDLAGKCGVAAPTAEEALLVSTVLEAALLMELLRQRDERFQLPNHALTATLTRSLFSPFRLFSRNLMILENGSRRGTELDDEQVEKLRSNARKLP
jgi:hypothetical protein